MRKGAVFTAVLLGTSTLALVFARAPLSQSEAKPVGDDACIECHEAQYLSFRAGPHGRAAHDPGNATAPDCETCHGPGSLHVEADGDKSLPGFATMKRYGDKATNAQATELCQTCHKGGEQSYWQHSAHSRKGVSCIECHSMHSAKDPGGEKQLKAETPTEMCFTCHKTKQFKLSRSAHMPLIEGGMNCTECHNPHGSAGPHQIRAVSNNELCEKCHADKRGPLLWEHAPVRENCVTCHEPHGSNNDKVLTGKKPFLCQRCHIGTRHPATLYDNPDLQSNRLFNRSCTNCHSQIHGSNHPSGKFFLR